MNFIKIEDDLKSRRDLEPIDKILYSHVFSYHDNNLKFYQSLQTISELLGTSISTIKNSIKRLENKGLFEKSYESSTKRIIHIKATQSESTQSESTQGLVRIYQVPSQNLPSTLSESTKYKNKDKIIDKNKDKIRESRQATQVSVLSFKDKFPYIFEMLEVWNSKDNLKKMAEETLASYLKDNFKKIAHVKDSDFTTDNIDNYSLALNGWWTHKWTFVQFLTRNDKSGMKQFTNFTNENKRDYETTKKLTEEEETKKFLKEKGLENFVAPKFEVVIDENGIGRIQGMEE